MPEKLQTFILNIAVIEGRHYSWPNMNSTVMIKVDTHKKYTAVKFNTDRPYYNEYFVFEFQTILDKMIDKNVTITVIKPGSIIRKRKILGYTTFDIGTVWYQKDHQMYHKWAILNAPTKNSITGTRGYLRLDVSILSKGQVPKIPTIMQTDDIEGNLFLPSGATTERQRINFIVDIYRAADLVKKNSIHEGGKKNENPPNTHIEVSFSGITVRTSVKKNVSNPVWNERLTMPEMFPPLCQRFRIDLYHDAVKRATRQLSLNSISSDKEEGFLPIFGTSFIHFYSPNHLEGYLGRVLISLDTVLLGDSAEFGGEYYQSEAEVWPLREDYFLKYENIVVFATIFDATLISRRFDDKAISFRLSCGPLYVDENGDKAMTAVTTPIRPRIVNKNYCFLPIGENKPCMHLTVTLPDIRKRIFNYNLLAKILEDLKARLNRIEDVFYNEDYKTPAEEAENLILETLDFISSAAAKYIDIASNYMFEEEQSLDKQRLTMSLKEMQNIMIMSKTISDKSSKKKLFRKIEKFYARIEALVDIVEDWPQIYLWMIYGNKRVAYRITQPRNVIHSPVEEEMGVDCGVPRTIYLQTEDCHGCHDFITGVAKLDVMIWMGLPRHLNSFLPSGFQFSAEPIPRFLISEETHHFQARAHIFQGRFMPGSDKNSLCDPFVQVLISSQCHETIIFKKILTPIWDQTLNFPKITLYGSAEFLLANPPTVTFDVFDKDECWKNEPVGKSIVKPIFKMCHESYGPPKFPLKLEWYKVYNKFDVSGEILTNVEFLELSQAPEEPQIDKAIVKIPPDIKPNLVSHRIEIFFWGVRELKKIQMCPITRPKIVIKCGNVSVSSETLNNTRKYSIKICETNFPEQQEYVPPLSLKMFDCRSFGVSVFAGTHVTSMVSFMQNPLTAEKRLAKIMMDIKNMPYDVDPSVESVIKKISQGQKNDVTTKTVKSTKEWKQIVSKVSLKRKKFEESTVFEEPVAEEDMDDFDWWTKFYASLEETPTEGKIPLSHKYKLKIYPDELEKQSQFEGFNDTLISFGMYKGKRSGDYWLDEENTTGIFKGSLRIYKWPLPGSNYVTLCGLPIEKGYFQDFPSNNPLPYILRIYCVRGLNLRPKDLNGKCDPYIRITLHDQIINDRNNCVVRQINPIFGRCFELSGIFPQDNTLVISVMDWDAATSDDLIGHTRIDIENRFYTKHRAHCGLAQNYMTTGYCQWRDQVKPTVILENLCKKFNIPDLEYGPTFVKVAGREFHAENFLPTKNDDLDQQILALEALKRWSEIPLVGCELVPEHVETRSLYNTQQPGIEQGKLQLWIDIFPVTDRPTSKQINIRPRKPEEYELRVVVWNCRNILLADKEFLTGKSKSDIFIKGWVLGPDHAQYTDVHYRSLSGEGSFNWRFIFLINYLVSENKIVIKKKSLFERDEYEEKLPCTLTLQAWDNDTFSFNEFLGIAALEISRIPKGSESAKTCSLSVFDFSNPRLNLFKVRRTKGWWPLKRFDVKIQKNIFAGALELEFELLTKEEAEKNPAGLARNPPQMLANPNRPETSFSWFTNPFKALKYGAKVMRRKIIKLATVLIVVIVIFFVVWGVMKYGFKKITGIKK